MRYRLRTLLILLAILPPLLGVAWVKYAAWRAEQERQRAIRALSTLPQPPALAPLPVKPPLPILGPAVEPPPPPVAPPAALAPAAPRGE